MTQLVKKFGKIQSVLNTPHLLELQIQSYLHFLQQDIASAARADVGLEGVFRSVFPIHDFNKTATLEFVSYDIGQPKFDVAECLAKGLHYEAPVRIRVRLVVFDVDEETGNRSIRDIKEQDIYFGTIPLMTEKGTFIINGTERVIVNQLQRSPGIIFEHDFGKTHTSRKVLYSSRIIPMRGSWLDFEFDHKDIFYVRIDRRRKMPVTILLKAMGMTNEDILNYFYKTEYYQIDGHKIYREIQESLARKEQLYADVADPSGEVLASAGTMIKPRIWKKIIKAGVNKLEIDPELFLGQFLAQDIVHPETGEVLAMAGDEITEPFLEQCREANLLRLPVLYITGVEVSATVRETMQLDKTTDIESAQVEIFRRLRPSSPPTAEVATTFFDNLFRNPDYYDLSPVGRYKLNSRLNLDVPLDQRTLTNDDILKALKHLVELKDSHGPSDDIDHLGNRRVRPVGELVENQYRIGLVRMERAIKERMSLQDVATLMPHDLINPKPVVAAIKEFFGTSQLSQFMDQTNPLSEVTHKRRLSALGPGGLTRDRAGFEVRDVHTSHYGRICPIETPEGPNIGLIVSMTTFAQVNAFGFIESPYRIVKNGQATHEVLFMDASREAGEVIAQANAELDQDGRFVNEIVTARVKGDFALVNRDEVTMMDISPSQIVSVSASLIPFLEHDDANRALMGSNMQRQAVPLLRCERPIVGTGMESIVAQDSGSCVLAAGDGLVRYADSERIVVGYEGDLFPETGGLKVYELLKFHKSNQNTCFGQKPLVIEGQTITKGQVLADGPGIQQGELALGKNLLVAFMPWCGYNFEDSILISERVVREDVFTSMHIEEFELVARDTKLGPEEVTKDIPNVGEEMLRNLDESGIIRIGAPVQPDDILVGKITPKGETQLTPEEKLLRAIFGDKARDVKNSSLKVPPGIEGTVIDVRVFNRRMGDKDDRSKAIEKDKLIRLEAKERQIVSGLTDAMREKVWGVVDGKRLGQTLMGKRKGEVLVEANMFITRDVLDQVPLKKLAGLFVVKSVNDQLQELIQDYERQVSFVQESYKVKSERITEGDDLPPGVIKMVKVYVAVKRKLSVGDKMAGRHGNKGVVSCILPVEDMPFFADGTPVDIVLNPLGVPSRMNIGQIMETHLGWGALELGKQLADLVEQSFDLALVRKEVKDVFASNEISDLIDGMDDEEFKSAVRNLRSGIITKSPVFDGAHEDEIWKWLAKAQRKTLPVLDGQVDKDKLLAEVADLKQMRDDLSEEVIRLESEAKDVDIELNFAKGEQSELMVELSGDITPARKKEIVEKMQPPLDKKLEKLEAEKKRIAFQIEDLGRQITEKDHRIDHLNIQINPREEKHVPADGKSVLYDGRTGDPFHNRVTVGSMYILKLHHLVDEKIHARSTGPYSLVTQQPLGGKAQFGGQRLGEMEVWAMEAYGAAHVLQEFLTVKSDDVTGRVNMYEKIVKGDNFLEAGLPESFNVLIKELMSLGLDVTLLQEEKKKRRGSHH